MEKVLSASFTNMSSMLGRSNLHTNSKNWKMQRHHTQPQFRLSKASKNIFHFIFVVFLLIENLFSGLKYGTGYGTSKKQAKSEAARESLEVLIPEMRDKITGNDKNKQNGTENNQSDVKDLSIFDEIKIEDPRVAEFCAKTTEPSPHTILLTCLQRNFGTGDTKVHYEVNTLKHKRNEFKMTVGKHTATVTCKNKKDGKQRASQAILQILHPHITNWGSLLRLYGNRSVKSFKEKKQEEQEITVLQSKAAENQPNYAILDKLQCEMLKLREKQNQRKIIGTFVPDVDLPTGSGYLNNVDL